MIFGALAATMFNTNALLHVVTETGKGKAVAAVNAITNTAAATQADKALYGKIIASSLAGFATIAYLACVGLKQSICERGLRTLDLGVCFIVEFNLAILHEWSSRWRLGDSSQTFLFWVRSDGADVRARLHYGR